MLISNRFKALTIVFRSDMDLEEYLNYIVKLVSCKHLNTNNDFFFFFY